MTTEQLPPELQRVHMVGIGGAGMSGIARILLDRGGLVSGSDAKESRGIHALRARGAQITIGHDAASLDLLPGGATAVITTHAAIPKTNPELVEARRRGIPVILRPAVLAKLMNGRTTLMVTGTHGKTTTTSMLIVALQRCGRDPSFAVGGEMGKPGPTPTTAAATASSPRPTKAMGRCSSTRPTSRWSPTSRPITWTSTAAPTHTSTCSTPSWTGSLPAAPWWCASTTPERRRWPGARPNWAFGSCATDPVLRRPMNPWRPPCCRGSSRAPKRSLRSSSRPTLTPSTTRG